MAAASGGSGPYVPGSPISRAPRVGYVDPRIIFFHGLAHLLFFCLSLFCADRWQCFNMLGAIVFVAEKLRGDTVATARRR